MPDPYPQVHAIGFAPTSAVARDGGYLSQGPRKGRTGASSLCPTPGEASGDYCVWRGEDEVVLTMGNERGVAESPRQTASDKSNI